MEREMGGGDFIVNKNITDYPEDTIVTYKYLKALYGYNARISMIWELLASAFGKKEFDILDFNTIQNGHIISWLMDKQIEFMSGKDVNMSEIYRALLEAGEFTIEEKHLFSVGNIEERIWGIFLLIVFPDLDIT